MLSWHTIMLENLSKYVYICVCIECISPSSSDLIQYTLHIVIALQYNAIVSPSFTIGMSIPAQAIF